MLRTVILAACFCALACLSSVAEARPGGHHFADAGNMVGCSDPVMRPCWAGGQQRSASPKTSRKSNKNAHSPPVVNGFGIAQFTANSRPARYIAGRLVCAVNVNAELARRGIRGTGSALAKSFLRWGRPSRPVAGAVAVYGRKGGGHVAIVSRVVGGRVYVWNPSSRAHRWREVEYRRRAIAYRVAGITN